MNGNLSNIQYLNSVMLAKIKVKKTYITTKKLIDKIINKTNITILSFKIKIIICSYL